MRVVETFYSIQGESSYIGRPCFFVRLAGCNLRCSYCDTKYAQSSKDGTEIPWEQIVADCKASPAQVIEFTGGEPLLQMTEVVAACLRLVHEKDILIETNGTQPLDAFRMAPSNLKCIVDIKTPSSGAPENKICWSNLQVPPKGAQFKFVVGNREDFDFAVKICNEFPITTLENEVLISPVFGAVPLATLADWVLQDMPFARMQVQLHKIIWDPEKRGV